MEGGLAVDLSMLAGVARKNALLVECPFELMSVERGVNRSGDRVTTTPSI